MYRPYQLVENTDIVIEFYTASNTTVASDKKHELFTKKTYNF